MLRLYVLRSVHLEAAMTVRSVRAEGAARHYRGVMNAPERPLSPERWESLHPTAQVGAAATAIAMLTPPASPTPEATVTPNATASPTAGTAPQTTPTRPTPTPTGAPDTPAVGVRPPNREQNRDAAAVTATATLGATPTEEQERPSPTTAAVENMTGYTLLRQIPVSCPTALGVQ